MYATDVTAVLVVVCSFGLPLMGIGAATTSFVVAPSNGNVTMTWNLPETDIREFTVFYDSYPAIDIFHVQNSGIKIVSDDYKNRIENISSSGSGVFGFEFFNVSPWDDAGAYGCYKGPPDSGGADIPGCGQTLIVVDLIQEPYLVVPESVTHSAGAILQCLIAFRSHPIGLQPKVSVSWRKNNATLERGPNYTMTADTGMWDLEVYHSSTLNVNDAGLDDDGARYSCQVVVGDGIQTDWSEEYSLGAEFSEQGSKNYTVAVDGDDAILSFWKPNISDTLSVWSPEESVLFTMESANIKIWSSYRSRMKISAVVTPSKAVRVLLQNVTPADAGRYLCGRGVIDRELIVPNCGVILVLLRPPVRPVIALPAQPMSGQTITVTCSTSSRSLPQSHPLAMSFWWFKDGALLTQEGKYGVRESTLTIRNVNALDSGNYTCQAKEEDGLVSERSEAVLMDVKTPGHGGDEASISSQNGGNAGTISIVVVAVIAGVGLVVTAIVLQLRKQQHRCPVAARSHVCETDEAMPDEHYSQIEIRNETK
ncbi:uncharacterized protein LOC124148934 [Haliotis rufescens]|uniref:uncharacterized protein LOC124148934 n=1 Tax=Haliotis rufescens TaxID=6454 RepID=UPI00201EE46F|nr:uncharacterized protein LOC124148934 [Haliotis rufescens]